MRKDNFRPIIGAIAVVLGVAVVLIGALNVEPLRQAIPTLFRSDEQPCHELPPYTDALAALRQHSLVAQAIQDIHPGFVFVMVSTPESCPDRGGIMINYATEADRSAAQALIGGDTFFGIPYEMVNR